MAELQKTVTKIVFEPTSYNEQQKRWLLDSGSFPRPEGFEAARHAVICFEPEGWAANHKHRRLEIQLAVSGDLYLRWRDEAGELHDEPMLRDDGKLQAFVLHPWVPHVVVNKSKTTSGVLMEWSNLGPQSERLEGSESLV